MMSPLDSLPVAIGLWLVIYVADYYLTLYGRRLWLKNAVHLLKLQGSYELNPYYQRDVDADNRLSQRFIFMLAFGIGWIGFIWGATRYLNIEQVFPAAVGFLVLMEVVVLSTHAQNIRSFQNMAIPGAVEGQISYARWVSMDNSAWKFAYWGVIYLAIAILLSNWFFAGGAISCLYEFLRFRRFGRRLRMQVNPTST